jgi:uncharacterized protein (TIGR02145 family)
MKKLSLIAGVVFLISTLGLKAQVIKDSEGKVYKTSTIGNQIWMAENLNTSFFRNGDIIQEAKTTKEWEDCYRSNRGCWCYYNNDPSKSKKYGKLYNWYAVNDPRGLAPKGTHVPSDSEWQSLLNSLGRRFSDMSSSGKFTGMPGGHRYFKDCTFNSEGMIGFWWTSTKEDGYNAWYHAMHFGIEQLGRDNGGMNTGMSIRCVVD